MFCWTSLLGLVGQLAGGGLLWILELITGLSLNFWIILVSVILSTHGKMFSVFRIRTFVDWLYLTIERKMASLSLTYYKGLVSTSQLCQSSRTESVESTSIPVTSQLWTAPVTGRPVDCTSHKSTAPVTCQLHQPVTGRPVHWPVGHDGRPGGGVQGVQGVHRNACHRWG